MLSISGFLYVSWWFVLVCFFIGSWLVDIPSKVGAWFPAGNKTPAATSTYSKWGYVRVSENPAQIAAITAMHEREIALATLKENHKHEEVKHKLTNQLEEARLQYTFEHEQMKRAFRLALFRWACMTAMLLTSVCQYLGYLDRKDSRRDNRLYLAGGDLA